MVTGVDVYDRFCSVDTGRCVYCVLLIQGGNVYCVLLIQGNNVCCVLLIQGGMFIVFC